MDTKLVEYVLRGGGRALNGEIAGFTTVIRLNVDVSDNLEDRPVPDAYLEQGYAMASALCIPNPEVTCSKPRVVSRDEQLAERLRDCRSVA